MITYEAIVDAVSELCLETLFCIRDDIRVALEEAYQREQEPARGYLGLLLKNAEVAYRENLPLSHDTGVPFFFVELGAEAELEGSLQGALEEGVRVALQEYPMRDLVLQDPLDPTSGVPESAAVMTHVEVVPGDMLRLVCMRTSVVSELTGAIGLLAPPFDKRDVAAFVEQCVREAGVRACPPTVVGVGIGSSFDRVGFLARRALLRPVGKPHQSLEYARFEQELLSMLNALGIGPGGLGGETTALAVHIEVAPAQEDAVPVAVCLQENAARLSERLLTPPPLEPPAPEEESEGD